LSEFRKAQRWQRHHQFHDVAERIVDDEGTKFHRHWVQDVEPIIDANTRVRNETNGIEPGRRKIGSIPTSIAYDWIRKWIAQGVLDPQDPTYSMRLNELLKEKLKDRDFAKFRTTDHV